ncbi:MAG: SMC-Scp complex subunit ScpB [Magnetospirillum sp. WYHS-4]
MSETEGTSPNLFDPDPLRLVEAILFASPEPVPERALKERLPEGSDVKALLGRLEEHYAGRGVNLVRVGASWAFRTAPDLRHVLNVDTEVARKLNKATIETLAIVAYHQPVTRAEIEEIRGVSLSKGTLDALLEAGWIKPRGRRETPGRPMTWGTTDGFLDHFGLESVKDLPGLAELKAAGLLDTRPAIQAYSVRADQTLAPVDTEALTVGPEHDETSAADPTPLDPDGGG